MNYGIILQTKEAEKAFNALIFAAKAKEEGNEVKIFLISDGVEAIMVDDYKFNASEQVKKLFEMGVLIMACTSCLGERSMSAPDEYTVAAMGDCVAMTGWADRVITF